MSDAWDAFERHACGLAYVKHQSETVERELHEYRVKCHEAIRQAAQQSAEMTKLQADRDALRCMVQEGTNAMLSRDEWQLAAAEYAKTPDGLRDELLALDRELEELKEWRKGKKGIEDYYIVVEKCDQWRACAERLAESLASNKRHSNDFYGHNCTHGTIEALAVFEQLKGKL